MQLYLLRGVITEFRSRGHWNRYIRDRLIACLDVAMCVVGSLDPRSGLDERAFALKCMDLDFSTVCNVQENDLGLLFWLGLASRTSDVLPIRSPVAYSIRLLGWHFFRFIRCRLVIGNCEGGWNWSKGCGRTHRLAP